VFGITGPLRSLNQTFKFVSHVKALVKHFLYGSYQEASRQVVTEVRTLCDLLKCGTVHKVKFFSQRVYQQILSRPIANSVFLKCV
jgi:hypothetical protein